MKTARGWEFGIAASTMRAFALLQWGETLGSKYEKSPQPKVVAGFGKVAGCTGLEPVASGVTGRRYNQLN